MTKVADEMLMAFADGELDSESAAAVVRAAEGDPAVGRRLASLKATRRRAKEAFVGVLDEPVPDRLVAAMEGRSSQFSLRRWPKRFALPIGAAVAAGVGFFVAVVTLGGPAPTPGLLSLAPDLANVLETVPSGEGRSLSNGLEVVPTASYLAPGAVCRTLDIKLAGRARTWHEVACRHAGAWEIELAVADPGGETEGALFAPASGGAVQSIDTFLEAIGAGESLDVAAERELREHGWRMDG